MVVQFFARAMSTSSCFVKLTFPFLLPSTIDIILLKPIYALANSCLFSENWRLPSNGLGEMKEQ